MAPDKIRLIHLRSRTVEWHQVNDLSWGSIWTISHLWDTGEKTTIPLTGVSWKSRSFSSSRRFNLMFDKTCEIVQDHGGEYVWLDAACIHQGDRAEKEEQVSFMRAIYGMSAGCVAFGMQTSDDQFADIIFTHDNGTKAWVCSWFERVWTFQELQLPQKLFFVSGARLLTREEAYLAILMISPYLTPPSRSTPPLPHDSIVSTQDVINSLSPLSRRVLQRALMVSSNRGCSSHHINDKVYGILGVLSGPPSELDANYDITLPQALLNLMSRMSTEEVLDTLMFNTRSPEDNPHDAFHWSGMIRLGEPMEHPAYEKDVYPSETQASVTLSGARATTRVEDASLWEVKITQMVNTVVTREARAWPSIASLLPFVHLTEDVSRVERSAGYTGAVRRAERSLAANWVSLGPLLERAVREGIGGEELSSFIRDPPMHGGRGGNLPGNRLGDERLFGESVTVLHCRSKEDRSFHYGIVVRPSEDGVSWHKVCTAAFTDDCIVATRRENVVIGR